MIFKTDLIVELLIHSLAEARAHNEIASITYFDKDLTEDEYVKLFAELRERKESELRAEIISKFEMDDINDVLNGEGQ